MLLQFFQQKSSNLKSNHYIFTVFINDAITIMSWNYHKRAVMSLSLHWIWIWRKDFLQLSCSTKIKIEIKKIYSFNIKKRRMKSLTKLFVKPGNRLEDPWRCLALENFTDKFKRLEVLCNHMVMRLLDLPDDFRNDFRKKHFQFSFLVSRCRRIECESKVTLWPANQA